MLHEINFTGQKRFPTKKLVWLTDLHLDAADKECIQKLYNQIMEYQPNAILIGGDVSSGVISLKHLMEIGKQIEKPFYFVLGNHDFYYGSIPKIRNLAHAASKEFKHGIYLTDSGVYKLTQTTGLVGHDGWSDARAGDFLKSNIILNDYLLIDELRNLTQAERMQKLHDLGSEAAESIKKALDEAVKTYERIIVLTHAPPYKQACLYEGKASDDNWTPHFVCKAMGDVLSAVVQKNPEKHFLVLCGHSHHAADTQILPNLRVFTGHSELGDPSIQGIVTIQ